MFTEIRWKIAACLAKKAVETTSKGGFENVKKGLKYFEMSLRVAPYDKEVNELIKNRTEDILSRYSNKRESC